LEVTLRKDSKIFRVNPKGYVLASEKEIRGEDKESK
jgi:hypothetical protein